MVGPISDLPAVRASFFICAIQTLMFSVLKLKNCEAQWILWLIRILIFSSSCGSISPNIII
jgi:hypothetical protein